MISYWYKNDIALITAIQFQLPLTFIKSQCKLQGLLLEYFP